jgi:branched-chain amino acid transport system ATP-binding protein
MTSLLDVQHLSISFGGVNAVEDVSFGILKGHIHAVIGPNGAGKTTLLNLITGIYVPTQGEIRLDGENIAGKAPEALALRGLSRTFQNLRVCMNMSAIENVMVGAHLRLDSGLFAGLIPSKKVRTRDQECRSEAAALMRFVGLERHITSHASHMSYGALKRLEIARALAARPKILLLDEPAAGLNRTETAEIDEVIRQVAESGVTVVLVVNDMKFVINIYDRLLVLDHGRKLAEGTAKEVQSNAEVICAYLGPGYEDNRTS